MEMKKMMKRAGLGLMLAAAMAGLAGCGGNGNKESASKPAAGAKVAKVGFLNGVSGGVASYGLAEKEGFDLAVEEVNKEGKIHFDVEMADTKGNVQQCVSAAQKMIAAKKVLVVGPLISGEYKAVGPLFQKAQIPLLGAATTAAPAAAPQGPSSHQPSAPPASCKARKYPKRQNMRTHSFPVVTEAVAPPLETVRPVTVQAAAP